MRRMNSAAKEFKSDRRMNRRYRQRFIRCLRLRLEVDIESWNSELELGTANASCLDALEFGIGNQTQYQSVFLPHPFAQSQYGATPL
jgi:hypothetical protein